MQDQASEQRVRDFAYHLWEAAGRPHGHDKEHWQRALNAIAGSASQENDPAPAPAPSSQRPPDLAGYVDAVSPTTISGWVIDRNDPGERVIVVVLDDGVEIGRTVASTYRADLDAAGIGDGAHGYTVQWAQARTRGQTPLSLRALRDDSPIPDPLGRLSDLSGDAAQDGAAP